MPGAPSPGMLFPSANKREFFSSRRGEITSEDHDVDSASGRIIDRLKSPERAPKYVTILSHSREFNETWRGYSQKIGGLAGSLTAEFDDARRPCPTPAPIAHFVSKSRRFRTVAGPARYSGSTEQRHSGVPHLALHPAKQQ
jgi:hypothetical protein